MFVCKILTTFCSATASSFGLTLSAKPCRTEMALIIWSLDHVLRFVPDDPDDGVRVGGGGRRFLSGVGGLGCLPVESDNAGSS
jgi:hypothetical protein